MIPKVQSCVHFNMYSAIDWKMMMELGSNLKFSSKIVTLSYMKQHKKFGLLGLTLQSEETVGEMKKEKYASLQEEGKLNGWKINVWVVEEGCKVYHKVGEKGITCTLKQQALINIQ